MAMIKIQGKVKVTSGLVRIGTYSGTWETLTIDWDKVGAPSWDLWF